MCDLKNNAGQKKKCQLRTDKYGIRTFMKFKICKRVPVYKKYKNIHDREGRTHRWIESKYTKQYILFLFTTKIRDEENTTVLQFDKSG